MSIYCYKVQGVPIDNEINNIIFEISIEMLMLQVTPVGFDVANFTGEVRTNFKVGRFGSLEGTICTAEVVKGLQAGRLSYLVTAFDIVAKREGYNSPQKLDSMIRW